MRYDNRILIGEMNQIVTDTGLRESLMVHLAYASIQHLTKDETQFIGGDRSMKTRKFHVQGQYKGVYTMIMHPNLLGDVYYVQLVKVFRRRTVFYCRFEG